VWPGWLLAVLVISLSWTELRLVAVKPNGLWPSDYPPHIGTYPLPRTTSAQSPATALAAAPDWLGRTRHQP